MTLWLTTPGPACSNVYSFLFRRFGLCSNAPDGSGRVIREEHQVRTVSFWIPLFEKDFGCAFVSFYTVLASNQLATSNSNYLHQIIQVELTWSINSGKTRLLWNNKEISHFFPSTQSKSPPKVVGYNWQSSSGVSFRIDAHAMPPRDGGQQYELFIDRRSFFSLPSASEYLAMRRDTRQFVHVTPDKTPKRPSLNRDGVGEISQMTLDEDEIFPEVPRHLRHDGDESDDSEDALRSDLYSSSLDALRGEMTSAVPELEEMMSRAIVYAYSEDHGSLGSGMGNASFGSFGSFHTEDELDPAVAEADALCESYEWMKWTTLHEAARDLYDLKLDYMRSQVETFVAHARHERLSPHAASHIMIGIAAILNLELARRMKRSTIILAGMRPDVTTEDVYRALTIFGQIETVCTATGQNGFGESLLYDFLLIYCFTSSTSLTSLVLCFFSFLSILNRSFRRHSVQMPKE
jgi:hypothetical protein